MKKLISALFVAGALALAAGPATADKLRIGIEAAYPPFSAVSPDGGFVGFDIDITNALCEEMGVECTMIQQDWDGIIPALLVRKFDAIIASMSITEERKKKVAFTNKYYQTPTKFAQKKGAGITIDAEGLAGKTVGVQRATTQDSYISAEFGDSVKIKRYATQDEANIDAAAGRFDLQLANIVVLSNGFLTTEQGKDWELIGPDLTEPKYFGVGAGIAVRKEDTELLAKLNKAIDAILRNGVYKAINDKYFEFNVYGEPLPQ